MRRTRERAVVLAAGIIAASASLAIADPVVFHFTDTFSGSPPGVAEPLTATFEDVAGGVQLTLQSNDIGSMFFSDVYFNVQGVDARNLSFSSLSATNQQTSFLTGPHNQLKADGDGYYDFRLIFPVLASGDRFTNSDTAVYLITGQDINAQTFLDTSTGSNGNYFAATHLQGYPSGASGWLRPGEAPPVPEPGTLMLLGSSLAAVPFLRRRRS